jgi:hypothetical protein
MSDADETTKFIRQTQRKQTAAVVELPQHDAIDLWLGQAVADYVKAGECRDERLQHSYAAVIAAILA